MATIEVSFPDTSQPGKLLKWRVTKGTMVSVGRILLLYQCVSGENTDATEKKLRATQFGRVTKLHVKEGDIIQPGQVFLTLVGCKHPTVMKDLCAECGADLREEASNKDGKKESATQASVPMLHSIPELKVCPELAEKIGKEDEQRLLQDRKLALLVDLDQTIVHTTNDNVPLNMKDVFHYQFKSYGPNSPWYHTRLRPGTRHFLSEMSKLYELHICTFGARNYAHMVAGLLDKEGTLFSHRILSRDECFDPASKTANLKALFPCGDDMVCIIDDREDVWQGCGNLVQVKPYHFFRHTGDIHAPPGLEKRDIPDIPELTLQDSKETEIEENEEKANGIAGDEVRDESVYKDNPKDDEKNVKQCEVVSESSKTEEATKVKESSTVENSEEGKINDEKVEESKNEEKIDKPSSNENERGKEDEKKDKPSSTEKEQEKKDEKRGKPPSNEKERRKEDEIINQEDQDDYLLYLEDILRRIHAEFYEHIDQKKGRKSLREIIPRVRSRVLKGLHLTFSGLIPIDQKLEQSRAYKVAKAFGAEVTQDLTDKTTHLVAIKPRTAKAYAAKKNKGIKIVNPNWLWASAERWERVDERLFPLTAQGRASRIPPPHCSSPDRVEEARNEKSDNFADSINPLMSFSAEDIEDMDKEVEEDMSDQENDVSLMEKGEFSNKRLHGESSNSNSDSDPDPSTKKRRKLSHGSTSDDSSDEKDKYANDDEDGDDDDDDLVERFRRGENLPDDLDLGDNSQDSIGDAPSDEVDDREWNALGAALEREFLSE